MVNYNFSKLSSYKRVFISVAAFVVIASAVAIITGINKPGKAVSTDPPSFSFGAVGDHGRKTTSAAVFQKVGASNLDLFLSLGDLSYSDPAVFSEKAWCKFAKDNINIGAGRQVGDAYGEQYPFAIISGNHESDQYQNDGLIDNFITPDCLPNRLSITESPNLGTNPSATGNYAKEYYADYPVGNPIARMIMVDPNMNFENGGRYDFSVGSPRYNWLANAIDSARAQGIKWIIVANHYNYVSAGAKSNETGGTAYFNLLVEKKVDLILQGHDHTYQRSKQFAHTTSCPSVPTSAANLGCIVDDGSDNKYEKGKGPILLISGSGGQGFYAMDTTDSHAPYFAQIMGGGLNPTDGFTRFDVTSDSIKATFVRASGGTFSDSFSIDAPVTNTDSTPPTAPTLSGSSSASNRVDLTWSGASDENGVTRYAVFRNGQSLNNNVSATSYVDSTVSPATTYTYTVRAYDAAGNESAPSNSVSVTTPNAPASTLTFALSDDATIKRNSPSTKFGSNSRLLVDNSPVVHTLVKVTVSGVAGRSVNTAKLRLYVSDPSASGGIVRSLSSNSWSEGSVTWNNAPAQNSTVVSSLGAVKKGTWVEFDLSPVITKDGTYSFRISSTSGDGADYYSRQAGSNKPQVVLTVQ